MGKLKAALLATTLIGLSAAPLAHAAEPARTEIAAPAAIHGSEAAPAKAAVKTAGLWAAAGAALAGIASLIGWRRLRKAAAAVAPLAAQAAGAVAAAPAAVASAIGKAARKPLRFAAALLSLILFLLLGFGFYDIEWAGGVLAGGLAVAATWFGAARARLAVRRVRARPRQR
jgi:hypothetical protein